MESNESVESVECPVCGIEHDDELHDAITRLRSGFKDKLIKKLQWKEDLLTNAKEARRESADKSK